MSAGGKSGNWRTELTDEIIVIYYRQLWVLSSKSPTFSSRLKRRKYSPQTVTVDQRESMYVSLLLPLYVHRLSIFAASQYMQSQVGRTVYLPAAAQTFEHRGRRREKFSHSPAQRISYFQLSKIYSQHDAATIRSGIVSKLTRWIKRWLTYRQAAPPKEVYKQTVLHNPLWCCWFCCGSHLNLPISPTLYNSQRPNAEMQWENDHSCWDMLGIENRVSRPFSKPKGGTKG